MCVKWHLRKSKKKKKSSSSSTSSDKKLEAERFLETFEDMAFLRRKGVSMA